MRYAIVCGSTDDVGRVLDQGADPNECIEDGISLLAKAVSGSHIDICMLLLERGAVVDLMTAGMHSPPLHVAAGKASVALCKLLMDAGANPNSVAHKDATALYGVATSGADKRDWVECMGLLLDGGADPNVVVGSDRRTILHHVIDAGTKIEANPIEEPHTAAWGSAAAAIRLLLRHGADADIVPAGAPASYLTPFQYAVKLGCALNVAAFIEGCDVDFAQRTLAGKSLRQLASHHPEVRQLLAANATTQIVERSLAGECSKDLVIQPVGRHNGLMPL